MPRPQMLAGLLLSACLALLPMAAAQAAPKPSGITVTRLTWHGWPGSVRLSNGLVEAIIVPTIGRIMTFQFVGHPETNPIFVNKEWKGKTVADAKPTDWAAFGGDKLWPSPQSEWPKHNVRAWPPDQTFDGDPEIAKILPNGVRLTTPDSVAFAARATRTITMRPGQPRLYIAQRLLKDPDAANPPEAVVGAERRDGFPIGIWTITQTRGDATVFLPLRAGSRFPFGFHLAGATDDVMDTPYFSAQANLLRITRDPKKAHKVGTNSPAGWMASLYGGRVLFSEHFTYKPGAAYPDGGTPAEVYTSPNPAYIEMELLGPMVPLTHGNGIAHDIFWQLQRLPHVPKSRREAENLVTAAMR